MGYTLEQARMLNKISREKAAKNIGVAESTLYRWEKGKSAPNVTQFKELCHMYKLSMDDVFVCNKD